MNTAKTGIRAVTAAGARPGPPALPTTLPWTVVRKKTAGFFSSAFNDPAYQMNFQELLQGKGISLVALNRSSIHNELLFRIPFYRDGVNEWRELSAVGDWVLFAITPETAR